MSADRMLNIGGETRLDGWEILNVQPGPAVDHLCDARDLSRFPDNSFSVIYASHIVEHLDYKDELSNTLLESNRALKVGGRVLISVPDFDTVATLILDKEQFSPVERFKLMRIIFGGHKDQWDYHLVGLNEELLENFLIHSGFVNIQRVKEFGLFDDTSALIVKGVPISLNMIAEKSR